MKPQEIPKFPHCALRFLPCTPHHCADAAFGKCYFEHTKRTKHFKNVKIWNFPVDPDLKLSDIFEHLIHGWAMTNNSWYNAHIKIEVYPYPFLPIPME